MLKVLRISIIGMSALAMALPAVAQEPAATQQAASTQDAAEPAPKSGQQQARRGQAQDFIYVEGSLPYVPTSNTIAAKLPLSLQLTPFNIGIVTRALFEEQYDTTIAGALVNVSNVNVQPGNGVHDYFLIRGFDSLSSALVMTDGAAEPEATFYELYNVENVEVLKGPSGFLYGSNPLSGTVNLVRKQPSPNTSGSVRGNFGRYNWFEGAADINYGNADGDFFFRLNSLFRDRDGYRDRIEGRTFAINPAATWQMSDDASLNVNFEYAKADYVPDSGLPLVFNTVPGVPRTNNYQSPFDTSEQNVFRLQADYQNTLSDAVTVRNKFYYRGLDWLSNGTLYNGVFPEFDPLFQPTGRLLVSRSLVLLDDDQSWFGNQLEAVISGDTGSIHHNLLLGFELARQADVFTLDVGFLPGIDLDDPVETAPAEPIILPPFSQSADSRAIIAAPYIVDQMQLHQRFHVLAGVRIDTVDFKDDSRSVSRTDTKASPMLGLVFVADEATSIYGNYSKSFAPPAPRVQTGDVLPEEGEQIELGIKREFLGDRARFTAAVYQLERLNIGIPDNNGVTQQVGSQRSRGFEVEVVAEAPAGVRLMGSYAYNDAVLTEFTEQIIVGLDPLFFFPIFGTVERSGNTAAFAPKSIFNAWVSKGFAPGFLVGGGARYVGSQFIGANNEFAIDSVLTFDAMASYAFRELQLDLNIKNLTNREYSQRGFGNNSIIPADPITVYLGVSYRR